MDNNNNENKSEITITRLFYYPLKSQYEIPATEVKLTKKGFANDRIYTIVKKSTLDHIKMGAYPKIYYITSRIEGDICHIHFPGDNLSQNDFELDLNQKFTNEEIYSIIINRLPTKGIVVSDILNKVCSEYFGFPCLFLRCCEDKLYINYHTKSLLHNWKEDDGSYFSDLGPLLITSEESLDYVNELLIKRNEKPVDMENFRPNLVIRGGGKYWEKLPKSFKINNAKFRNIKPCERCKVTTYSREDKKFKESEEPLTLLKEINFYEELDDCVFGYNYSVDLPENTEFVMIKVGDVIYDIEY